MLMRWMPGRGRRGICFRSTQLFRILKTFSDLVAPPYILHPWWEKNKKTNFNPCFVINYLHLSRTFLLCCQDMWSAESRCWELVWWSCRLIRHSVEEKTAVIKALSVAWWRASHCAGSERSLRTSSNTAPQTYALRHTEITLHLLSQQLLVCSFCRSFQPSASTLFNPSQGLKVFTIIKVSKWLCWFLYRRK